MQSNNKRIQTIRRSILTWQRAKPFLSLVKTHVLLSLALQMLDFSAFLPTHIFHIFSYKEKVLNLYHLMIFPYIKYTVLLILILPIDTNAQIIKINNSLSANWSNNGTKKIYKYNPTIGLEYLESSHFLLSSSIGVSHKNQEYPIFNGESTIETNIKYLEISTTGRFKFNTNDISFFIGIGPAIDWKIKSNYKIHGEIKEYSSEHGYFIANKNVINLLTEAGLSKDLNKLRLDFFAAYRSNITNIIPESRKGFIGHSLSLNLSFGYKF